MAWYTWALIAVILYVALLPIFLGVLKIGRQGDTGTEIQHDEHEEGLPL